MTEAQGTNDEAKYGFMAAANFFVKDMPGGGGGAAGGVGGFYLSREDMAAELEHLRRLKLRIEKLSDSAQPLWSIQSPGQDPASLRNTEASNRSGEYYRGHLERESGYLGTIIAKMESALGITENADEQAGADITKQGGGVI